MHNAQRNEIKAQQGSSGDECEEVSVIAAANTVVKPDAMMILGFDAVVADFAVMATRRTPYATGSAVFDGYFEMNVVLFRRFDERPGIRWRC